MLQSCAEQEIAAAEILARVFESPLHALVAQPCQLYSHITVAFANCRRVKEGGP